MRDHTSTQPCSCGGVAEQVFNADVEIMCKGNQRPMVLDERCVPLGWERGNTDCARQEAAYAKIVGETRDRARKVDKQAIKGGIRHIARVPRELQRLRTNQYGKDYLDPGSQSKDEIKAKLKSDGLLFKD